MLCCPQLVISPIPVTPSDILLPPSISIGDRLQVVPTATRHFHTHCLLTVFYRRNPASLPTLPRSLGDFFYYGVICRCQPVSSSPPVAVTRSPHCHLFPSHCLSAIPRSSSSSPVPVTLSAPHCLHPVEVTMECLSYSNSSLSSHAPPSPSPHDFLCGPKVHCHRHNSTGCGPG